MIKVSVIVPIYKVENYIERCARSLFEQTLDEIEYIFVDDCSPDKSIQVLKNIVEEYPHRLPNVRILKHVENMGLTAARNTGLGAATGEYVAHCDSDDWVEVDMYEKLYSYAVNEGAEIAICDFYMEFGDQSKPYHTIDNSNSKSENLRRFIITGWPVIWNILAKRSLYYENNLKSPEHITYCEDFYLAVRLIYYAKKIAKINECLHHYNRVNTTSLLNDLSVKSIAEEYACNVETYNFFQQHNDYGTFEQEMSWRILRCQKERVLNPARHQVFIENTKFAYKYIWSCPFINTKMKFMMWMLTHRLRFVVRFGLTIRSFLVD